MRGLSSCLQRFLQIAAASIIYHDGVDAFRAGYPPFVRRNEALRSRNRNNQYPLRTLLRLKHQPSSSETSTESQFPQKLPQKRRRNHGVGSNNIAKRSTSRALLNSFEEICQRERRNRSLQRDREVFVDLLNSMVRDLLLLEGKDIPVDRKSQNLSHHILPRDASSLIRLLGRNGAHDAMLQFCRRYCRDILDESKVSKYHAEGSISRLEAEESILFAYTAAIAACSKPPPTSLSSSEDPQHSSCSKYRSKSFLLSLVNEMEHGYTEDGSCIRPNSYTLSAVLLGIDDVVTAMDILEEFEEKYEKQHDDNVEGEHNQSDNILTVQVYNVVLGSCSKSSSSGGNGWQRALSMLQRMRRSGPQPNEQTYSMILQACAEHGQMKVATSLLDEIRQSPTITPTAKLYLPLLKVCARYGHSKMAWSLINIMKDDSLEMTTEIMNLYLAALAKNKLHLRALGVLQEMIADPSLPPDIVTFNTVLSACANADDYEGAQALLDQMKDGLFEFGEKKLVEIKPDVVSYNSVISCADPDQALSLIQEMRLTRRNREGVVSPNSITYVNAISQCRKFKDDPKYAFEIAMHLLDLATTTGVDLNVFIYSASIWMAEANCGDYQTAVRLLREMECSANEICYDGVISAFSQHGLHREALYFYYEMQHLGLSATRKTYQRLVFAIDNTRDPELSMSCQKKAALLDGVLLTMPENDRSVQIGGPLFESLITNHGNASDPGTSYQASRKAFDNIVGPVDDHCLSAMLRVCSSVKPVKWEEAILLIHSSDIVNKAYGPGLVSSRALSYAVIACAKADQWEEALNLIELYRHHVDQGITESKLVTKKNGVVRVAAINCVIRACGRSSRPDIAVQLLNDMSVRYGVDPDEVSYRLAIIACNQAEHREMRSRDSSIRPELQWWECALSLLRRMSEDEIKPSLQTFSSVVSSCEAAGEWQRAIGVLRLMPSFSPLIGDGKLEEVGTPEPANLYCLNAAISACEKGGAWVEALQLFENTRSMQNTSSVRPNFITVSSLLIALEKANQLELAESIYKDAVREKIVLPWKRRYDSDGKLQRMMDLHKFSEPMAKIAVRSHMETTLSSRRKKLDSVDAVFIVGKGKRSEEKPVLMPAIIQLLHEEYGIDATVDKNNKGRIRVAKEAIEALIERRKW
eukprot:CAMPEP_0172331866 /NCGR_PEP_ID=MMETSP1058-20130122/62143_1 /TAXON_ID=83371 /ORGANISM="Detonula confervacea, Strain CCMP 353" /LENGTH=1150 /DNA_ID=CAMNT_0013049141 /DNA_START=107 /DNA_END=3556 /DNA_ORIENTATION=+